MKKNWFTTPGLSKTQLCMAIFASVLFYLCITLFSNSKAGKTFNYNLATNTEFKLKNKFEKSPVLHPSIKILSISDPSVSYLNRSNLYFHEWARIIKEIEKFEPKKIIIDKIFGVSNFYSGAKQHTAESFKSSGVPVITGAFLSQNQIPKRSPIDYTQISDQIKNLLKIDLNSFVKTSNQSKLIKALNHSFIYGRHESLKQIFQITGYFNYKGQLRFHPLSRLDNNQIVPFAGLLAADKLEPHDDKIRINSSWLPVSREQDTLINLVDIKNFYKRIRPLIAVNQYNQFLKKDDLVIILPGMFTGGTDFHESPVGYTPGGLFITSVINSVLTDTWISEMRNGWILTAIFSIFGVFSALYFSTFLYWSALILTTIFLAGSGLASFIFIDYKFPWLWCIISFSILSIIIFIFKSVYIEKIKEISDEIKDIMNSVDEIIFTFNPDLSLNSEASRKSLEVLSPVFFETGDSVVKIFDLPESGQTELANWIQLLFQTPQVKKWKKLHLLCPVKQFKLNIDEKINTFESEFIPIIRNSKIVKIMGIATDVTRRIESEKRLEQTRRDHKIKTDRILAFINNERDYVNACISESQVINNKLSDHHKTLRSDLNLDQIFREVHTVKGNAGSLGFSGLEKYFHQIENSLSLLISDKEHQPDFNEWSENIKGINSELQSIMQLRSQLFDSGIEEISIDKSHYKQTIRTIKETFDHDDHFLKYLVSLNSIRFLKFTKKYQKLISEYSEKTEKPINPLRVENPANLLHKKLAVIFDDALIHIIRNAIDHGIEDPAIREEKGKGPGNIKILHQVEGPFDKIVVEDDGKGVDAEAIFKKAIENGICEPDEQLTDQQKFNLIFEKGFSSKESVTELSGRGIGLDAVKTILEKFGGGVKVSPKKNGGTVFALWLPTALKLTDLEDPS